MPNASRARFTALFDPRSVAVIGATPEPQKVGYSLMRNLLAGKPREIFPVTVSQTSVLGKRAYRSVLDIESPVDLALIAVRADIVPHVLTECGKKRVPFAVIISAGFKESGGAGIQLEEQIRAIAKKYKISLLGPNCLGVMNGRADLNGSFAADKPMPGDIAFVSQSGALGSALLDWATTHGVGFSKFVSLGNEAGLTELDFLDYLATDTESNAVLIYLEHVTDGATFMALAGRLAKKKPVVLIKAGRSARGRQAVASHTGSLAPEDAVFTAACRASGIIVVESLRELFNLARLFRMGIRQPLRRLAVLTNGGGPSVIAADLIDSSPSLELAELSETTKQKLRAVLPPMASVGNPVDIIGDGGASRYEAALGILINEKNVDAIMVMLTPQMMTETEKTAELLVSYAKKKPLLPVFMGGAAIQKGVARLEHRGLGNFWFPDDVVSALEALALGRAEGPAGPGYKKSAPASAPTTHAKRPVRLMDYSKTEKLLRRYGIRLDGAFVRSPKELPAAGKKLGKGPLAMKIVSPDVVHKTDAGGVVLNIADASAAAGAWEHIIHSVKKSYPKARVNGMVLQRMRNGKEVIIGMKRDPVFGPAIIFGLGGIFVEAMKDTALRVAPVNAKSANEMVREIKGFPLLKGLRGERPVNIAALEKLAVSLSRLALANPKISEIDLNPVIATAKEAVVVDARVILNS
ncbi:MAG: hypothetical protein RL681_716 [Candidatus Parcubacteria bacterium]